MRRGRVGRSRFGRGQAQTFVTGTDQSVNTKGEPGSIPHTAFQPQITWLLRGPSPHPDRPEGLSTSAPRPPPLPAADMLGGSGTQGRRSLAALSQIAYQRNDDDEEEAARERRRRARQERLRQKQEEESLGQMTDQVEVNTQNSVPDEEVKTATTNTQVEGDEEAALLERLARREERRQKRLQEALERQKEFDPTVTDASLSLPSRRMQNNMAENESAEKEEKSESRQERYEIEETEIVTKSHQKNDWGNAEEKKKEEKEKEEEEEEKPKPVSSEETQVEVVVKEKTAESQEETVVPLKNGQMSAEEPKVEEERGEASDEIAHNEKMEEEARERAEAERARLEAEEREKIKAEQDQKIAEEKARVEAEEKAAAQERERQEAEERERIKEEERRAAEERERIKEEEKRAAEERERIKEEERRAAEERERIKEEERRAAEERQRAKAEAEERAKIEEQKLKKQLEEKKKEMQEKKVKEEKVGQKIEGKGVNEKKVQEDKPQTAVQKKQIKDEKTKKDKERKEEVKSFLDGKKGFTEVKSQNGEFMTHKLKHTENTFSRPGGRASEAKEAEGASQVEAGKRLEELRRRRGETESEEFEKLKQKQQEAALELEELKKKREERRKVLEEEEQRRKQEEAERKVREEEEKRRLKEEIERRRAEAAEKRQKMPEDGLSDDKKPFKCFTPKGSSLKIEERAEFLNKSVQKSSGVKSTHQAAVVSKIDSRLEQYTSAIEGTKTAKPAKPAASDLPVPAEGVRNIKSMWEKGSVFSSPSAPGAPNKETAGLKVGVSSRINEWLTKTPDGNKSPAPKPSDLRPGDVSGKRNLWEKQSVDKVTSPTKQV
ncbi:caldesmon isoform X4 [Camelus dromedarius]|uniref:Caldesmon isoform X4 n=2 Tax=Camelus TaxID=9836 RepID=A0A8B8TAZ3_CAMFR|nr:caldesmon isoform X4 [Camelus dromedarius]XP_032339282.1 caldesmon isoform X4 [Camelus ferus]